jgi:hypothetical protein
MSSDDHEMPAERDPPSQPPPAAGSQPAAESQPRDESQPPAESQPLPGQQAPAGQHGPDRPDPPAAQRTPARETRKRIAGLGGALALVVAVGAWFSPDLQRSVCGATDARMIGCNQVPDKLVGTWTGTERCLSPPISSCLFDDSDSVVTVTRGRAEDIVVSSRTTSCRAQWTLQSVQQNDVIDVHTERSTALDPTAGATPGVVRGCPADLVATLSPNPDGTLQFTISSGPQTTLGLPPNIPMFTARLTRT